MFQARHAKYLMHGPQMWREMESQQMLTLCRTKIDG